MATEMNSLFLLDGKDFMSDNAGPTTSGFTDTMTTSERSTTVLFSKIAVAPKL